MFSFAEELGMEIYEKRLTRDEVYLADEAFFTGTAAEVTPICNLDERDIGEGHRGPITQKLQAMYFDQVAGKRSQHPEWHTIVGQ
jgi:branched-chain amino acid aminotransferase